MAIKIRCSECGKKISIDEAFAGGVCRCPYCRAIVIVPGETGGVAQAASGCPAQRPDRPPPGPAPADGAAAPSGTGLAGGSAGTGLAGSGLTGRMGVAGSGRIASVAGGSGKIASAAGGSGKIASAAAATPAAVEPPASAVEPPVEPAEPLPQPTQPPPAATEPWVTPPAAPVAVAAAAAAEKAADAPPPPLPSAPAAAEPAQAPAIEVKQQALELPPGAAMAAAAPSEEADDGKPNAAESPPVDAAAVPTLAPPTPELSPIAKEIAEAVMSIGKPAEAPRTAQTMRNAAVAAAAPSPGAASMAMTTAAAPAEDAAGAALAAIAATVQSPPSAAAAAMVGSAGEARVEEGQAGAAAVAEGPTVADRGLSNAPATTAASAIAPPLPASATSTAAPAPAAAAPRHRADTGSKLVLIAMGVLILGLMAAGVVYLVQHYGGGSNNKNKPAGGVDESLFKEENPFQVTNPRTVALNMKINVPVVYVIDGGSSLQKMFDSASGLISTSVATLDESDKFDIVVAVAGGVPKLYKAALVKGGKEAGDAVEEYMRKVQEETVAAGGRTDIVTAIQKGLALEPKSLVLFMNKSLSAKEIESVVGEAKKHGTAILTIALDSDSCGSEALATMDALAKDTGGQHRPYTFESITSFYSAFRSVRNH